MKGISLFEVMTATFLFAIFATVFISNQTYNINDSVQLQEEVLLTTLCQNKLNQTLIELQPLQESMTLSPIKKTFEETEYQDYEYTIEYKKLKIPSFDQIMGRDQNQEESTANTGNQAIQKIIIDRLKENIEAMIWQIRVTVRNKKTDFSSSLSTWITNKDAQVNLVF